MENMELQLSLLNKTTGGGRIGSLDAIKCLGIILVIEGHVRQLGMGIKVYDTLPGLMLYSFNMPLFFFVSGFLAYKCSMSFKEVVRKIKQKFIYLIVPTIVFKLFYDLATHGDISNIINEGFKEYWFTISLFECFLVYYLLYMVCKNDTLRIFALLLIAIIGVGFLSIFCDAGPQLIDFNHLTKYFQFFVLGVIAMRYKTRFLKLMCNEYSKAASLLLFFVLLFLMDYEIRPTSVYHLLRDIVLRYLGTFVVVSFFISHASWFNKQSKINSIIMSIGQKSLAIYLLQYFFLPDIKNLGWIESTDLCTIHIISILYTIVITTVCLMFITFFSNSGLVKKYCLGQK